MSLLNERLETGWIGTCENCKATEVEVRSVEGCDAFLPGESRGHWTICFKCEGRKIFWGKGMQSPADFCAPRPWPDEAAETPIEPVSEP